MYVQCPCHGIAMSQHSFLRLMIINCGSMDVLGVCTRALQHNLHNFAKRTPFYMFVGKAGTCL